MCIRDRALVREPDLLLMDEPFSNLDSAIKSKIQNEIYKILKKTNTTTILVTHDIKDTFNISVTLLEKKLILAKKKKKLPKLYMTTITSQSAQLSYTNNNAFTK